MMSNFSMKCIAALLAVAALTVGPCGASALADIPEPDGQGITYLSAEAAVAGPVSEAAAEGYVPDPEGSVSFANLSRRMREGNLQVLAIQESVDMLEEIDYDSLKDDLRDSLNKLADAQWQFVKLSQFIPLGQSGAQAYEQLEQGYAAVRAQFDAIEDGDMQDDNALVIRQLKNVQNQLVMAGEATYIALAAMEIQAGALERQLAALDRQLAELELRYKLGQIPALTLQQAQAGRAALGSGLSTLRMNLNVYKGQLEMLIGADITGNISLGAVPNVTQEDLSGMDLERDLVLAKERSWSLYDAAETLKDEENAYNGKGGDHGYIYKKDDMSYMQARHNWYAAKYTYDNTVKNFELGLRNLYLRTMDYGQILDAAKTALSLEQKNYEVAQLKHSQGTLSENGLLEAGDKLKEAEEKVAGAENDLFSSYNTYRWAVDYGILN